MPRLCHLLYGFLVLEARRRPRRGLRALAAVFAPFGVLPILLLLFTTRRRVERVLVLATALLYAVRYRPRHRRLPQPRLPTVSSFSVLTWNILFSNPHVDDVLRFLATAPAAIVALQELTPGLVERLRRDPALATHYPYQIAWPYGYGDGMALLSRYPILEQGRHERPSMLWALLDLGPGRRLALLNAHPTFFPPGTSAVPPAMRSSLSARLRRILDPRFLWYNPDHRDDGIRRVRDVIDRLRRPPVPLLVVGDFNVTEREPAYQELTAGLLDAQHYAGRGSGLTWRPEGLRALPFPILRIDYLLHSPELRPVRIRIDRTRRGSDHCIVYGEFEL